MTHPLGPIHMAVKYQNDSSNNDWVTARTRFRLQTDRRTSVCIYISILISLMCEARCNAFRFMSWNLDKNLHTWLGRGWPIKKNKNVLRPLDPAFHEVRGRQSRYSDGQNLPFFCICYSLFCGFSAYDHMGSGIPNTFHFSILIPVDLMTEYHNNTWGTCHLESSNISSLLAPIVDHETLKLSFPIIPLPIITLSFH